MRAYLFLDDGTVIEGEHFGSTQEVEGEVVFTTAMTGYCESLTDPSYAGQIIVFTYPLMGNYGVPKPITRRKSLLENFESERIWAHGVVVSCFTEVPSHYAASLSFSDWLKKQRIPGISLIDTRALTQKIRTRGTMRGAISLKNIPPDRYSGVAKDIVGNVSCKHIISYAPTRPNGKHIALIDCGVKHGILRELLRLGYRVTCVPWNTNPLSLREHVHGVVVSNGPGNPKDCAPTIASIQALLARDIPILGICLGHQLLAIAVGADTYKLPYGHRGVNQPCQELSTKRAYITSQNHGYAVIKDSIPKAFEAWFVNLNDGTIEGIRHKNKPITGVQFHPEGCPGPYDTKWIYEFV